MPISENGDTFDRECTACGHHGMNKTQAPSRNGPRMVFKCPSCGATDPVDESPGGMFVSKR